MARMACHIKGMRSGGMVDLTLVRVVHQCRELGEILECAVALCPMPKGHLYQLYASVNPETGRYQSSVGRLLDQELSLREIESVLVKYIKLSRLRQEARRDIAVAEEA
jgi:hypothetical protein